MFSKLMKKIILAVVAGTLIFSTATVNASANDEVKFEDSVIVSNEVSYIEGLISVEEFQSMKLKSKSSRSAGTSGYVWGHNRFTPYYQTEFTQVNGCGPTAVANILSFYQEARGVSLYNGECIDQNIYNQICADVNWSSSGTNMVNVSNGIQTFFNRAGKTCLIDSYLLNLWSDVTRDVNAGLPILVNNVTQRHFLVIFGYDNIDGQNYLYVCTGLNGNGQQLFGYLPWGRDTLRMRSVNIY